MRDVLRRILMFFCRDVGEQSVEKDVRQAFLIKGHIMQTTRRPSRDGY